ncbi:MAG: NADPH-dependent 7-cyano-7-deazaguanine reductase QueF [Pseudomonadales bacterium]
MVDLPLGQEVVYVDSYSPDLLCLIARQDSRHSLGITAAQLPFTGVDIWNAYELSWLNLQGKPIVACAEFRFPCESDSIIESKSFKLYLNSFNQSRFKSVIEVEEVLIKDLSLAVNTAVEVIIRELSTVDSESIQGFKRGSFEGACLDQLDISVECYLPNPELLCISNTADVIQERLYSHLLRSLCPVTGQPDWGSVVIEYTGARIDREGLLTYLIGYRQHQAFHEQCVERMFTDIQSRCKPRQLSVYARYLRRGGLDINPFRSTGKEIPANLRLNRQ